MLVLLVVISGISLAELVPGSVAPSASSAHEATVSLTGIVNVNSLPPPPSLALGSPVVLLSVRHSSKPGPGSPAVGPTVLSTVGNSSVSASVGFDGLRMFQSCSCAPPDVQVAAGPNHVMEMVNLAGEVFTKQGTAVKTFSLSSFFNTGSDFISDPKVLFDSQSGRWFASIIDCSASFCSGTSNVGRVVVAVSTTNDPTGTWRLYTTVVGTNEVPDQPIIGVSDDKFVISVNSFVASSSAYQGAEWIVFNKNDLLIGASPRTTTFGPFAKLESVHPVQSLSSTTTQYMVSVGAGDVASNSTAVTVFSITGVPGVSTVTNSTVSLPTQTILTPPLAVEPDGSLLDTGDFRVQDAAWHQGKVWLSLNDGCTPTGDTVNRSCIRLVQINTSVSPFAKTQDFDFGINGEYAYYAAVRFDGSGNLDLVYGFTGSGFNPSLAVTGQATTDPAGSLVPSVTIKQGLAVDKFGRYGDYFGAGVDPSDTSVVWVAGEYDSHANGACDLFNNACWFTFVDSMSFKDFSLSSSPSAVTFNSGSPAQSTVTAASRNGFTGTVTISATASPAPGVTVSCDPTTLSLGASASSTCSFSSTAPRTYSVTIAGTSGPRVHTALVTVNVAGFSFTTSPSLIFTAPASTTSSTVTVASFNGFTGTVSLTSAIAPVVTNGPMASLNPSSGTVSTSQGLSSTLTISTTSSTPTGVYTVTVNGTSGSEFHSFSAAIVVQTASVTISSTNSFPDGQTVTTTGTMTVDSSTLTISGTPNVVVKSSKTGKTLFSRTYTVSHLALATTSPGNYQASFLLPAYVSPYNLSSDVTATISGGTKSSSVRVTRDVDIDNNGVVGQLELNTVAAAFGCSIGQSCYNPLADLDASGTINIFDLATVGAYFGAPASIPDFTLTASSSFLSVPYGGSNSATISLTSINTFAGTVNLVFSTYRGGLLANSSGLATTLTPTSITLTSGGTGTATLSVSSNVPATYVVVVKGTSGSLAHNASITVTVQPCFRICPQSIVGAGTAGSMVSIALTSDGLRLDAMTPALTRAGSLARRQRLLSDRSAVH